MLAPIASLFYGANQSFLYLGLIIYNLSYYSKIFSFLQCLDFRYRLILAGECTKITNIVLEISHQNITV
jgi:hypothetical protein